VLADAGFVNADGVRENVGVDGVNPAGFSGDVGDQLVERFGFELVFLVFGHRGGGVKVFLEVSTRA